VQPLAAITICGMDKPTPWRTLVVPVVIALIVWWLVLTFFGTWHGVRTILVTPPPVFDESSVLATDIARFVLGAAVIGTIAYGARIRAVRIDQVVLVIWTVIFAIVATGTRALKSCSVSPDPPIDSPCAVPVDRLVPQMVAWLVVSAAILTAGYLLRRGQSARKARGLI
jgi:hypothetical protein